MLQIHEIDIGYYINNSQNDFSYCSSDMKEVYIFNAQTGDFELIPCLIYEFKFSPASFSPNFQNANLVILCPERLKHFLTFYHFAYCCVQFLYNNHCTYPIFTSLSFINQMFNQRFEIPNFWHIQTTVFHFLTSSFHCKQCQGLGQENYFKCTNCFMNRLYFPLLVFAGAHGASFDNQTFLLNTFYSFLKTLFIQWNSEIKSINPGSNLDFLTKHPESFYRIVYYLLCPQPQLNKFTNKPNNVSLDLFQLLPFLQYPGKYHYIFPAFLYAYGPTIVSENYTHAFRNPHFRCEISQSAREDSEKILGCPLEKLFKNLFTDTYSTALKNIKKAHTNLDNYCKLFKNEFEMNYGRAIECVQSFDLYYKGATAIFGQLHELNELLRDMEKNYKKYNKQDIVNYGNALSTFCEKAPESKFRGHNIEVLTKIFFQSNIAQCADQEIRMSTAMDIFIGNNSVNIPDPSFLDNETLIKDPFFKSAFSVFNKKRPLEKKKSFFRTWFG